MASSSSPSPSLPAIFGGHPTPIPDIPICSAFLTLFLTGAISHITLFRHNLRHGHKFIPSAATFGFCMSRLAANSIRIAWSIHPQNQGLAIAAQILVAAGVLILYILNLLFAQRLLRASYPGIGWSRILSYGFKAIYGLIVVAIIMVITVTIQSFNTSNRDTKRIDRDVQLAAITYMAVFAFLPVPVLVLVISSGRKRRRAIEMFGKGKGWVKLSIVVFTTFLMCLAMAVRAVTAWEVKPAFVKPWFDSKAAFYVFTFASEIVVVFTFLGGRVDQRFYVPDGSSRVRHYGGGQRQVGDEGEVEDHGHVEVQERGKLGLAA